MSLYEKLATVDNVDLFVGPDWSSHGFPVSQLFEKYKIPSVMSNVATPKVYESGFKYIAGMALDARTWSKNYFDMLSSSMNPKPKSMFWIVQDNLVTKAVHETNPSSPIRLASRPSESKASPAPPRTSRARS